MSVREEHYSCEQPGDSWLRGVNCRVFSGTFVGPTRIYRHTHLEKREMPPRQPSRKGVPAAAVMSHVPLFTSLIQQKNASSLRHTSDTSPLYVAIRTHPLFRSHLGRTPYPPATRAAWRLVLAMPYSFVFDTLSLWCGVPMALRKTPTLNSTGSSSYREIKRTFNNLGEGMFRLVGYSGVLDPVGIKVRAKTQPNP